MTTVAKSPKYRNTSKVTTPARAARAAPVQAEPPEIEGFEPRELPEREYAKTEHIHAEITALLSLMKVIRADDVMRELNLTRSNANFHMQKMAAKGLLCLALEPYRGQNRFIAARDFRVLAEMIEPAPPQRGEARPARA